MIKLKPTQKHSGLFFHDKTKSKSIPDTLTDDDPEHIEPAAKTNLFTNYFQSVFAKDQSPTHCNADNVRPVIFIIFIIWKFKKKITSLRVFSKNVQTF